MDARISMIDDGESVRSTMRGHRVTKIENEVQWQLNRLTMPGAV